MLHQVQNSVADRTEPARWPSGQVATCKAEAVKASVMQGVARADCRLDLKKVDPSSGPDETPAPDVVHTAKHKKASTVGHDVIAHEHQPANP